MFITIINDCSDDNVMARQQTRATALFSAPTAKVRVNNDIEAAGNIIDVLDAAGDAPGVILVNVAPRSGKSRKWPNGTPFGYFTYKKTIVGASIDGLTLSLVKKLHLTKNIHVFDIPTVMDFAVSQKLIEPHYKNYIASSQFRSFDFLPRAIKWVVDKKKLPTTDYSIQTISDIDDAIWWIDNFGNAKTSVLPDEINHSENKILQTLYGPIMCYDQLRSVPDKKAGLVIGSSGIGKSRFIELVIQGGSASKKFSLASGMGILKKKQHTVLKVEL